MLHDVAGKTWVRVEPSVDPVVEVFVYQHSLRAWRNLCQQGFSMKMSHHETYGLWGDVSPHMVVSMQPHDSIP